MSNGYFRNTRKAQAEASRLAEAILLVAGTIDTPTSIDDEFDSYIEALWRAEDAAIIRH
jgi:hypothetical protein